MVTSQNILEETKQQQQHTHALTRTRPTTPPPSRVGDPTTAERNVFHATQAKHTNNFNLLVTPRTIQHQLGLARCIGYRWGGGATLRGSAPNKPNIKAS